MTITQFLLIIYIFLAAFNIIMFTIFNVKILIRLIKETRHGFINSKK